MALFGMFETKREEVIGDWRKLHSGALLDLYLSCNIFSVISTRDIPLYLTEGQMGIQTHYLFVYNICNVTIVLICNCV
jgi:hypothetical protein